MHSLKDISFQSGVSLATVDRVIHGRGGVKTGTMLRVEAAIRELDRQARSVATGGRRVAVDIIMEAPKRFSQAVRRAFEAELEGLHPASMRLRFHMAETFQEADLHDLLRKIRRRGTHGVVAKLPHRPQVATEIARMVQSRIPVVTFVTDLDGTGRQAYIGMDNVAAGRLAAYLVEKSGGDGDVLAVVSSNEFQGEAARLSGFNDQLRGRNLHVVHGTMGRDVQTAAKVRAVLERGVRIGAVYSAAGGNKAITTALRNVGQKAQVFVAHDLDADNQALMRAGEIDFVIHHDLRQDARSSCQHILKSLKLLPAEFEVPVSAIQLATPWNMGG